MEEQIMEKAQKTEGKQLVNKFNPQANYMWKVEDKFELSGKELEILHNTLGAVFSGIPDSQMYLMLNECLKITSNIIKREVEVGTIVEAEKEEQLNAEETI